MQTTMVTHILPITTAARFGNVSKALIPTLRFDESRVTVSLYRCHISRQVGYRMITHRDPENVVWQDTILNIVM